MLRAWLLLSLAFACLLPSQVAACNIPVFRYALERWPTDPYRVTVFHRGPLSPQDQQALDELRKGTDLPAAVNCAVELVDVAELLPAPLRELWQAHFPAPMPRIMIRYPDSDEERAPLWAGPHTAEVVRSLTDSPARREVVRRLMRGDSVVWLLLESGDKTKDEAAGRLVKAELEQLQKIIKVPEGAGDGSVPLLADIPLEIRFSTLRLARTDPAEKMFVAMLLGMENDLLRTREPVVFPLFGRGRVLAGLAGKEINAEAVRDGCTFLCGACSCLVKRLNPGTDLLLTADWEGLLQEKDPKEPVPSPTAAEVVPIPHAVTVHVAEKEPLDEKEPRLAYNPPEFDGAAKLSLSKKLLLAAIAVAALMVLVSGAFALRQQRRQTLARGSEKVASLEEGGSNAARPD